MPTADIKDFNIRYKGHPKYNINRIVEDRTMEFIIQKLEMVLMTNKGEVLDDYDFGANLEYYLWSTKVPVNKIENEIQEQINTYIPEMNKLDYTINIELFQGTIRDILKVNIKIKESELNFILK
ncbi:MAG: hypothetical protein WDA02_03045 [Saccharofermentanales bacterium]|jgi:hypothetical protein